MDKCKWTYDEFHFCWETQCGEAFTLEDGTPKENKMKFCCYCGKQIEEVVKE